ncbi:hypothetical protein [Rubinisphaera sp.]|uniref:hypothetical protein n=1 Tax=Rubinisphaera sp. TaxID=2024857 RepID=UPI000C1000EE|nr:hypothetical protein [Rubinisphaera sp.]MBV09129.1 hypothetical protein [Rubinisphaera sp.]HCS54219.1 hypothetical protein [Planctomycetaceae bacterium]|tara:strand:- start:44 stop:355 length:312 start_codon:yes stop_codon:yes gene_type:complete
MKWFRYSLIMSLFLLILISSSEHSMCEACPMCKMATEDAGNSSQPAAYMASILTMLSMPSILFSVVGISLYRMSRREAEMIAQDENLSGRQSETVDPNFTQDN